MDLCRVRPPAAEVPPLPSQLFTFMPPAWDSYAAAVDAVRTDPGRVRLNRARLQTIVSQPILLGVTTNPLEIRYVREFSAVWIAEPGTFRIIGDWLHYEPLCTVTVPVNR